MRLDLLLTERGLVESRSRAKRLIESGAVLVGGEAVTKSGAEITDLTVEISICEERFVGRGGEKLLGALSCFRIDPTGKTALDIGAST